MTVRRFLSIHKLHQASIKQLIIGVIVMAVVVVAAPLVLAQKSKTTTKTKKPDKTTLQSKKKKLQSDIDFTNKLLNQTRQNKKQSLNQLVALNQKIEARESLINTISSEIRSLDKQIDIRQQNIQRLAKADSALREEYKHMIVFAYRNRNAYQRMMFLFSADNFNQAYKRMRYMRQLNARRQFKVNEMAENREELNEELKSLREEKSEKKKLLGIEENEQGMLASEKTEKQQTFIQLQSKEKQLKEELDRQKKQALQTDLAIQKLIADEAARAAAQKVAAAKKATSKPSDPTTKGTTKPPIASTTDKPTSTKTPPLELTPDAQLQGKGFLTNRGALPWPVTQGSIVGHYGQHQHPVFEKVIINNNGIDIATTRGASVRSVFEGEVTGITNIPGAGWLVIVRHGDYLTVYANLDDVQVKTGDKVKTKQIIGRVLTNAENDETVLHFEVWKSGSGKMNPEEWIVRREG